MPSIDPDLDAQHGRAAGVVGSIRSVQDLESVALSEPKSAVCSTLPHFGIVHPYFSTEGKAHPGSVAILRGAPSPQALEPDPASRVRG